MANRSLKASELTGRHIYQTSNKTVYADLFTKNYGYIISDDDVDTYNSYSLRLFESILGFALLLFVTKSNIVIAFLISLLAYIVISLLFYLRFLKKLPKIENFKKEKKDNYIVSTAKEMSAARILVLSLILILFAAAVIYYPFFNNSEKSMKILMLCLGTGIGIFALMNLASLLYKTIKRV